MIWGWKFNDDNIIIIVIIIIVIVIIIIIIVIIIIIIIIIIIGQNWEFSDNCYALIGVIYENYLLGRKRALWYVLERSYFEKFSYSYFLFLQSTRQMELDSRYSQELSTEYWELIHLKSNPFYAMWTCASKNLQMPEWTHSWISLQKIILSSVLTFISMTLRRVLCYIYLSTQDCHQPMHLNISRG